MSAPHPDVDLLRAYAVGDLHGAAGAQAEAHLLACRVCRTQVVAWRTELAAQVDALPAAGPLPPRRPRMARSGPSGPAPRRRPAPTFVRPAALLVLAAAALVWGGGQHVQVTALRAEQRQVADWLARPGVAVLELSARNPSAAGHLLLLPGREVLFVLPPPTPGKVYQVWVASNWKRGDPLTPSARSARGVLAASVEGRDYVCISLEDAGRSMAGQTRPTVVLGWTSL